MTQLEFNFFNNALQSKDYAQFFLETTHGSSVEIGNVTFENALKSAKAGVKSGEFYAVDYFTWDGEKFDYTKNYK